MKESYVCHDCLFCKESAGQFACSLLGLDGNPQKECDRYLPPLGRYDEIDCVKSLICEIANHGMSAQQHDLNRIADIVGNATVGELAKIANSTEKSGNMTVGARLYRILFKVWNYEQAVSFYNEHTLLVGLKNRELRKERDALAKDRELAWKKVNELEERVTKVWRMRINLLSKTAT